MIPAVLKSACAALGLLCMNAMAAGPTIGAIDQSNLGPFTSTNGAASPYSFGQSFVPTATSADRFEFLLGGVAATVVLRLRDGVAGTNGLSGAVIAETTPVTVDFIGSEWFGFQFAQPVALSSGQTYVAELAVLSGSLGVRLTEGNAYGSGMYLAGTFAAGSLTGFDLVFAEGMAAAVPEPASWATFMAGGLLLAGAARSRKR